MAFLNHSSVLTTSSLSTEVPKLFSSSGFSMNRKCCLTFGKNGSSFSSQKICLRLRESVIAAAKKNNKKHVKKEDTHSFVVRPDEATGPYPEAVLLKEKKVQEDGRLLPEFADDEERELFEQLTLELESDLDVDRMRHYEVVYMIHEDHVKEVESINLKVQEFIKEKKGKLWRFSDWGLRRLAYKIKKARNAHYILVNFEFEAKWINDFKAMLDQDERVIRHLVIKKDKAETKDCPPPPEFHTIRAGMDDDNDDDVDDEIDIDDEYDDDDSIDDEYDYDDDEEEEEERGGGHR
ncbi:protein REGULATOR OF FATTY ACID COMPOSITION 3, chloroplastic-like [Actinidia eriantha]|uniref:protein REGULATOR OF FATTY ACID COMPOSITION 3, chloroplastic-like n=1 Tax=Actinidia eriantha TaxID=165200 RepID=UPI002587B0C9|nr:protein REGULATOR OF FATTY ACID COMPOSITION 3, chloroplastic-like [Actinidia eriantha]